MIVKGKDIKSMSLSELREARKIIKDGLCNVDYDTCISGITTITFIDLEIEEIVRKCTKMETEEATKARMHAYKIDKLKTELVELFHKYGVGVKEIDNYNNEEEISESIPYIVLHGEVWYAENLNEILAECFGVSELLLSGLKKREIYKLIKKAETK